ncbi:MBL fold metallo-hydrolase, partial [Streptomyces phaeochromogenes]|uniref:MBL fold metallo-hydrolase n=1 Tax=Streptomyces phaeochromogenes TaxID=1923 RepID=UPI003F4D1C0A
RRVQLDRGPPGVAGAAHTPPVRHGGRETWTSTRLEAPGRPAIDVTATPARHGPPLSRPVTGDVIGFALRWEGRRHGVLWISGDTVLYEGVREVARRLDVGTALLHLAASAFR